MNTLTAIEAERVLQILRHASDRIKLLTYVPTIPEEELLDQLPNPIIQSTIAAQWQAEELLRKSNDSNANEMGGKDYAIVKKLQRTTRNTCRNLLADRESLQILMDNVEPRKDSVNNFIAFLNDLKSHVHQKLTTTVEDEAANRSQLHDLGERERQTEEMRDALQGKLNEVREEKDKTTFGLDQVFRKLQLELQDLTHLNKVETESVNRDMSEAISKATSDHKLRMKQLSDQVDGLERQLSEVAERNREEEQRLRKEKNRVETTLSSKIAQYDEDMSSRQEIINNLQVSLEKETKEYAILKEYFDKVDADLFRQNEEEVILSAVSRRYEYALGVIEKAVVRIQSIIRAKKARIEVEKLKSKSKKGKKGKGKKK